MAYDLLGNLLAEFGRFDEAYDCFARAIAIAPLMAGTYYDLVRCRPVTTADGDLLARMEAALATPGLEAAQRLQASPRARQGGGRSRRLRPGDAALRRGRRRAPGLGVVRLGRVRHRDRPPDRPLHARPDRAGAGTRQRRRHAGADHRHAAIRHDAGRADHLQPPRGRRRRRAEFLERARRRVAREPASRGPKRRSSAMRRPSISACCARSGRRRRG